CAVGRLQQRSRPARERRSSTFWYWRAEPPSCVPHVLAIARAWSRRHYPARTSGDLMTRNPMAHLAIALAATLVAATAAAQQAPAAPAPSYPAPEVGSMAP